MGRAEARGRPIAVDRSEIGAGAPPDRRLPHAAALLLIAAVAAVFRLYDLTVTPPGLHVDEAVNGLDILITIPQQHPIFFELNNGREPLFIYAQALAVALLGPTPLALRVTAALFGIATALALYWLGCELFGRRVGLIAALGLSTSLWHVVLSRVGLRGISAPLFWVLTLALLWRGIHRRETGSLALAGVALSLGLYTYLSARFAVVLVALLVAYEAAIAGKALLRLWRGFAFATVLGAIVVAPLASYFVAHPDSFVGRGEQVSILNPAPTIEGKPTTLRQNVLDNLGMFFVRGDDNPRHNVPGRPVFDPIGGALFGLGLGVALVLPSASVIGHLRRRRQPTAVSAGSSETEGSNPRVRACVWLLLWLPLGLTPGLIAHESPNYLRLTVLAPAVFLAWALGIDLAARAITALARSARTIADSTAASRITGLGAAALIAVVIVIQAGSTWRAYFGDWANRTDVFNAFDGGLARIASAIESSGAAPGEADALFYVDRSPTVLFLSPQARGSRWMQGYSDLLLLPKASARSAVYAVSGTDALREIPRRYFASIPPEVDARDPSGAVVAASYRLDTGRLATLRQGETPVRRQFGDGVVLEGISVDRTSTQPGGEVAVTLLWRQLADAEVVYAPFLHVVDERGKGWGQDDLMGFAVGGFKAGDQFVSRHIWLVPADAPPLGYRLEVGMATRPFGWPPGLASALGPPVDSGTVQVSPGAVAGYPPSPKVPSRLEIAGGPTLFGHDGFAATVRPGDVLRVDLLWQAVTRPARDIGVSLKLIAKSGKDAGSESGQPVYGRYPTRDWPAGATVRDPRAIPVAGDAGSGEYTVIAQVIDVATGADLGSVELGRVTVVAPERSFTLPTMQRLTDVTFGSAIALRGFDLSAESIAPGADLGLTLYWQAVGRPDRNYTVFAHLLDANNRVVGQQDSQPAKGQAPTSGWTTGQVVVDRYELRLQPDADVSTVVLEIGLYDAATGERLKIDVSGSDHVNLARIPVTRR